MVRRGRQAANSILKQAADWNNCCSSLCTKPYRSVSVILALKWQALLLRRTDISFCCCLKKTMGSEIPHYGVTSGCWIFFFYFFFSVDDISVFHLDMLGKCPIDWKRCGACHTL